MAKRWAELKRKRIGEERLREIRAQASREILELELKAVRELAGVARDLPRPRTEVVTRLTRRRGAPKTKRALVASSPA
jgi:hypothetical protein